MLWYSLSLEELAASTRRHVAQGLRALKLRLGRDASPAAQVARVQAVRQAADTEVRVMVDATESWDVPHALHTGRVLQDAGITWLEDPVHHQDVAGLAQVASALDIPVTGGEHLYQIEQFNSLFQARAVDIAILDLARVGGITPWRKIAALAQAYRVPVCGHVVPEVHVHLLAAVPNGHMVEYMPRSAAILRTAPVLEEGDLLVPQAPGLGISLDEAAVQRCRVV
jgi:L-alanine-DL-glutamate epimerase-like enolase superfamily enzyme